MDDWWANYNHCIIWVKRNGVEAALLKLTHFRWLIWIEHDRQAVYIYVECSTLKNKKIQKNKKQKQKQKQKQKKKHKTKNKKQKTKNKTKQIQKQNKHKNKNKTKQKQTKQTKQTNKLYCRSANKFLKPLKTGSVSYQLIQIVIKEVN